MLSLGGTVLAWCAPRRLILSHAREEAYLPLTRVILAKLGYAVISAEDWPQLPLELRSRPPDLRIVDELRLGEIADPDLSTLPTLLLTGRQGVSEAQTGALGAVRKPAGLHDLYRLIQGALEETPRGTPRVDTYLPAHCRAGDRDWRAVVISLSESGCLLRSPEPLPLGCQLGVDFDLPGCGSIETRAESTYQLVPDHGLVFHATAPATRDAILDFVEQTLSVL